MCEQQLPSDSATKVPFATQAERDSESQRAVEIANHADPKKIKKIKVFLWKYLYHTASHTPTKTLL